MLGETRATGHDEHMSFHVMPYVKGAVVLDQVAVHGVRVQGWHGVHATERESGQLFVADVVVHLSTAAAADKDDLARTVNYSDLADRAAEILAGDPADLIETVAEKVAFAALSFPGVECVDVRIHKPQAPLHVEFKDVTVTVRRDRDSARLNSMVRIGSSAGLPDDPSDPGAAPVVRDAFDERPAQPVPVLLALGGNIGEAEATLRSAVQDLERIPGVQVTSTSPLVRSAPQGGPAQPDYLNAVVRVHTALSPRELLAACQGIEVVHGRVRGELNGPRTLDIDIIDFDGLTGTTADLTLPHPRAAQRSFVLVPWAAMEPEAVLTGSGRVADAAAGFAGDVTVLAAAWPTP